MMELMSQEALRLGADRRREVALATKRDMRAAEGVRHVAGGALVALVERIAGDMTRDIASGGPPMSSPATAHR